MQAADEAFGVYIHWPFCRAKCPYCDFNSHVRADVDETRFISAIRVEIARFAKRAPGRTVTSVFFGGGTPSLMSGAAVAAILEAIADGWPLALDAEITLEANPTSVEASHFADYRAAGVNRISLGVQALRDDALKALGRQHSAAEAMAAVETARACYDRVSFDLIYARPAQTLGDWRTELTEALSFADGHLSLYQLTIEPGTRYAALYRAGKLKTMPPELAATFYDLTTEVCAGADFKNYEISNYAREGEEARHNLLYWRGGDYAGVGPGAHSRLALGGVRHGISARRDPEAWLRDVERGSGDESCTALTKEQAGEEYLLMALRLSEGASLSRFAAIAGRRLEPSRIELLESDGLLHAIGDRLIASSRGRLVLDRLLVELTA